MLKSLYAYITDNADNPENYLIEKKKKKNTQQQQELSKLCMSVETFWTYFQYRYNALISSSVFSMT